MLLKTLFMCVSVAFAAVAATVSPTRDQCNIFSLSNCFHIFTSSIPETNASYNMIMTMSRGARTSNRPMYWGILCCLLGLFWFSQKRGIPKGLRLPPGPPGKFFFGNASDLPSENEWLTFAKWGKEYGDVVHVQVLNTHMIFLNSADVAHELLENRSSIYSDRYISPMMYDLMGAKWNMTFMPYGERWRQHRKTLNKGFHQSAVVAYHEVQTKQTRKLLKMLLESPEQYVKHIRYHAGAVIMEVTYGIEVLPDEDPYVRTAEVAMANLAKAGQPRAFWVDIFPPLKYVPAWMPGAGFRRKARAWRVPVVGMNTMPFEVVKKRLAAGTAKPSILTSLLEDYYSGSDPSDPADQEEIIRNSAGAAYLGGADTSVATIIYFILAMVLHPEFQRKAQKELDSVLGDRLPTFNDHADLPYISAICKEVLRWHPVAPLATPHRLSKDDVYGDYFIPEGTLVVGNAWAMLHDEKIYGPEPEKFNPDRFLKPGVRDPIFAFGFGRRLCPGRFMAENSFWIAVASILKVFNISHARDNNGHKIPVKLAYTSSPLSHPLPFQCSIKPRHGADRLIAGAFD